MYPDLDPLFSLAATQAIAKYGTDVESVIEGIIAANAERGDLQGAKIWTIIASRIRSMKSPPSLFSAGLAKIAAKQDLVG
jgi:hypothetical protein